MNYSSIRRVVAFGAAIAAITFGLGAGTADASVTPKPVITLQPAPLTAIPAGPATAVPTWAWSANAKHVEAYDTVLTIDARGLAKVAKVVFSSNCTAKGLVATCWEMFQGDSNQLPQNLGSGVTQLSLTALAGAKQGATGSYRITGRSAHATIVGGSGQVTVGGPSYVMSPLANHVNARVGSIVSESLTFSNVGTRPANGSRLLLMPTPGVRFTTHYANCGYRSHSRAGRVVEDMALCSFPGLLRVGEQVTLTQPVGLQFTSHALFDELQADSAPWGDSYAWGWATQPIPGYSWKQGKGVTLGLKVLRPGRASSAPAGTAELWTENQGSGMAMLGAKNTADFGTTGSSAKAAQGKTVTMTFTLSNHGSADLYDGSGGEGTPGLMVTPPPGTTVVGSSASCGPWGSPDPSVTAHGPYYCWGGSFAIWSGTTYSFKLTLRVDKVVPGATGTVRVRFSPMDVKDPYSASFDPNPKNNAALLHLN
ncbi:hypothetical protein ABIA32_004872 [Streptacidiphilus sp. MAP12-20]|uniref:hypothetical protein n=1 Tax=Streptacidiphilus sp. MAP12-20 TaxID=3156299 RepID=UPI003510DDFA